MIQKLGIVGKGEKTRQDNTTQDKTRHHSTTQLKDKTRQHITTHYSATQLKGKTTQDKTTQHNTQHKDKASVVGS
jgi:hypothetical protein